MREEKALQAVSELQDRLRDTIDEKRDIEMEFVALKKNYITLTSHIEKEKDKYVIRVKRIGMTKKTGHATVVEEEWP